MQKSIYSDEYAVFARKLREARIGIGLKQTELAARIGKPHSYISRIENRQIRVDVIELKQICEALGFSFRQFINELIDELSEDSAADSATDVQPPAEIARID